MMFWQSAFDYPKTDSLVSASSECWFMGASFKGMLRSGVQGCSSLLTAREDHWLYTAIPQCRPVQNMTSIFQLAASLQAVLTQQNYLESGGGLPGPLTVSCHLQHQDSMSLEREWMFFTFYLLSLRFRGKGQMFVRTKVGEGRGLSDIHSK